MNYLYIGGPSRSGTTALTSYLNRHPEVMICRERFKWIPRKDVTPEVFTFERILNFEDGYEERDTARRKQVHEELVGNKDPQKLRWMGDKYPAYVRTLERLSENNPGASFILTYRPVEEVAESYEARSRNPEDAWLGGRDGFRLGVEGWNRAMRHTRDFIESGVNPNVFGRRIPRLLLPQRRVHAPALPLPRPGVRRRGTGGLEGGVQELRG